MDESIVKNQDQVSGILKKLKATMKNIRLNCDTQNVIDECKVQNYKNYLMFFKYS